MDLVDGRDICRVSLPPPTQTVHKRLPLTDQGRSWRQTWKDGTRSRLAQALTGQSAACVSTSPGGGGRACAEAYPPIRRRSPAARERFTLWRLASLLRLVP